MNFIGLSIIVLGIHRQFLGNSGNLLGNPMTFLGISIILLGIPMKFLGCSRKLLGISRIFPRIPRKLLGMCEASERTDGTDGRTDRQRARTDSESLLSKERLSMAVVEHESLGVYSWDTYKQVIPSPDQKNEKIKEI